jgi:small neutral amino acid transporter SnatA (MarC family)
MLLLWKHFALGFSALLPLINPLGSALIFLGLVGSAPIETYRALARRIAINTVIFLAVIEVIGSYLLSFFGIVVMLTLSVHTQQKTIEDKVLVHIGLFLAVLVLSALIYLCYAYAPKIERSISPATAHGILRVVAFILLCIGVQIAWNGLSSLVTPLLHAT